MRLCLPVQGVPALSQVRELRSLVSKVKLKINKHNIVNQLHVNFKNQKKIETVNVTKEDKSTFFISGGSFSAFSALTLQLQPLKVKAS